MYYAMFVHCGKGLEQRPKIHLNVMMAHRMIEGLLELVTESCRGHDVRYPKILMPEMW